MEQNLYDCIKIEDFERLEAKKKEAILNNRKPLLKKNKFLGDTTTLSLNEKIKIKTFDLPRVITCINAPMVKECEKCYQKKVEAMHKGADMDSSILNYRKENLVKTLDDSFITRMVQAIKRQRINDVDKFYIRIHSDGEFYSSEYMKKWISIAWRIKNDEKFANCSKIDFVAYTKAYEILKGVLDDRDNDLHDVYESIFKRKLDRPFTMEDIGIHFIISRMQSTNINDVYYSYLANTMMLPVYYACEEEEGVIDCKIKNCVDCQKCYPCVEDIKTILRK